MPAAEIIHQLAAKFKESCEACRSGKYNEGMHTSQEHLAREIESTDWGIDRLVYEL